MFVQLLSAAFRVSQCHFVTLSVDQRVNVESCIRTLSEVAKARAIAIPSDLDMKVSCYGIQQCQIVELFEDNIPQSLKKSLMIFVLKL